MARIPGAIRYLPDCPWGIDMARLLPFDRIGGREPVAQMVDRFYDLMHSNPAYAELRAMHGPDLTPMRESLTDFLVAWMGGPRDWFEKRPGACIMSMHRALPDMNMRVAVQWTLAMKQAAEETVPDDREFTDNMIAAMAGMSKSMAAHAGEVEQY